MQRQCQAIKAQLDGCRKEQEKLLMQIKSLLTEREELNEEHKRRVETAEVDLEKAKSLEFRLAQALSQKDRAVQLLERVREALPSTSLQRIFGDLVGCVHESFKQEQEHDMVEKSLL
jgi:chromosome segregation ATPase